jgi:hypothetical protein
VTSPGCAPKKDENAVTWTALPISLTGETGTALTREQRVEMFFNELLDEDTIAALEFSPTTVGAYLAVRTAAGDIVPQYFLVSCPQQVSPGATVAESLVQARVMSLDDAPSRWPAEVANIVTRWDAAPV